MTAARIATVVLLVAVASAFATDYSSAQNGPWGMASTWSPPGVPDSSDDNVTVNHGVTVDGTYMFNNLEIGASGTLTCAGDYVLWPFGAWVNNGRARLTAGTVEFVGPGDGTIAGDSVTTFFKLVINKQGLDTKVTQQQAARVRATGLGSLNIVAGTLVTNGQDLDADVENSVVAGGEQGKLDISGGGTVSMWMLQQDGLKYVSVSDSATLNISSWQFTMGTCRFEVTGGRVNYTQTNGWNFRIFGASPPGFGYIVTGGTVTFYGDVVSSVWSYFDASGEGVIRFAGSTDSRFDLMNAFGGVGWAHWALNDLRIEKTGGATVRITASGTTLMDSNVVVQKGVTVNPGARLILYNPLFNGTFGFAINNVTNRGVLVDSNYTYVSGNWTNMGEFQHGANLVTFEGAGADTLAAGNGAFYDVTVNKPAGTLATAGNLGVEHYLTVRAGTLALSEDTLAVGTGASAGTVSVNGGVFSAVGTSQANSMVMPAAAAWPYRFAVAPGGNIGARYATFENMDTLGLDIAGAVDATDNFSWCTFDHGVLGGRMLRLGNAQTIDDINGANFSGSAGYNIEKPGSAGHVTVHGGTGTRWGEEFDLDPNNLVDWTGAAVAEQPAASRLGPAVSVTPSPVRGQALLCAHVPPGQTATLSVVDVLGRVVYRSSFVIRTSSFPLDLRSMRAGVYFARLDAAGQNATAKVVLQ